MNKASSLGVSSLFVLSLSSLPMTAQATTTAPSMNPSNQAMSKNMGEGGCSRMMGKTPAKPMESKCTSQGDIRAHGGKCGKSYMEKHGQ